MSGASVPETPVNKDSNSLTWENEIRFAVEREIAPPSSDAGIPEQSNHA
jgi:hypothetical protein